MSKFHRILFPVDLSENSLSALGMATQLAKQNDAKLCFVHVSPILPLDAIYEQEYYSQYNEANRKHLKKLRPSDASVGYEHLFLEGNAGPAIAKATKTADLCVMSTHGRSGVMRMLLGSVAQYVLRNAKCPVVLVKGFEEVEPTKESTDETKHFVTEVMHQVSPVREFEPMTHVLSELQKANETGAPVVDDFDRCIGILTMTDIKKYQELKQRFEAGDETVIDEVFECDQYGQRRTNNDSFDNVKRHMTKDVIYVNNDSTIEQAIGVFESNPGIHHLVVLDDETKPVGIIESSHVVQTGIRFLEKEQTAEREPESTTGI